MNVPSSSAAPIIPRTLCVSVEVARDQLLNLWNDSVRELPDRVGGARGLVEHRRSYEVLEGRNADRNHCECRQRG
jgi:hypothetical protein